MSALTRRTPTRLLALFMVLLAFLAFTTQAITPPTLPVNGERVALVIGSAAYRQLPELGNSANDARAIGRQLTQAGFEVDLILDGDIKSLRAGLQRLQKRLQDDKVKNVVFFYAGHAVQLDWRNFLIAVDAKIQKIDDVPTSSIDVGDVLNAFAAANANRDKQFVVILDACRDNPFPPNIKLTKKGLSQFDAPPNTLVAFSTAPGQVAYDGDEDHSFYTAMLLREMAVPHVSIEDTLKRVRMGVRVASLGRQIPWESTSLEKKFFLYPPPVGATRDDIESVELSMREELDQWLAVKKNATIDALVGFLQRFPNGNLAQLAQHMLDDMLFQRAQREAGLIAQRMRNLENPETAQAATATASSQPETSAPAEPPVQVASAAVEPEPVPVAREPEAPAQQARPEPAPVEAQPAVSTPAETTPTPAVTTVAVATPTVAPEPVRPAPRPAETVSTAPSLDLSPTPLEKELLTTTQQLGLTPVAPLAVLAKQEPLEASIPAGPTFAGAEPLNRRFRVGDSWRYDVNNRAKGSRSVKSLKVSAVDAGADRVQYNDGEFYSDLMGNATNTDRGTLDYPRQFYPANLQVGASWVSSFTQDRGWSGHYTFRYELRIVRKERIRVPAGEYEAYRIEANGRNLQMGHTIQRVIWVVPGINANIAVDVVVKDPAGNIEDDYRWELKEYSPVRKG